MLLGLFSLVPLFADDMHKTRTIIVRSARWYPKEAVTFSEALATVRRQLWTDQTFAMSRHDPDPKKPSNAAIDLPIELACYVA